MKISVKPLVPAVAKPYVQIYRPLSVAVLQPNCIALWNLQRIMADLANSTRYGHKLDKVITVMRHVLLPLREGARVRQRQIRFKVHNGLNHRSWTQMCRKCKTPVFNKVARSQTSSKSIMAQLSTRWTIPMAQLRILSTNTLRRTRRRYLNLQRQIISARKVFKKGKEQRSSQCFKPCEVMEAKS